MTFWVLAKYGFSLSNLLGAAVDNSPKAGEKLLGPGLQYGTTNLTKIDFISLALALVLGTAGLPHVLMRFYTVPSSQGGPEVGRVGHLADRHLLPVHPGPRLRRRRPRRPGQDHGRSRQGELGGAAAGLRARRRDPPGPHLRGRLRHHPRGGGGPDDHGERELRPRHLRPGDQAGRGRGGRRGQGRPDHRPGHRRRRDRRRHLRQRTRTSRSSWRWPSPSRRAPNLPTILYSLFWKRFNTRGALWSIYGGLVSAIMLIVFSPVVSGKAPVTRAVRARR